MVVEGRRDSGLVNQCISEILGGNLQVSQLFILNSLQSVSYQHPSLQDGGGHHTSQQPHLDVHALGFEGNPPQELVEPVDAVESIPVVVLDGGFGD